MVQLDLDSRRLAENYDELSDAQFDNGRQLLELLQVKPGSSVLDIGCGTGRLGLHVAENLGPEGRFLGIDPLHERIRIANSFVQQDARAISLKGRFDLVFSAAALHWVKEHDEVLRGMRYSLNPGGRILLQMGGSGNAVDVFAALQK